MCKKDEVPEAAVTKIDRRIVAICGNPSFHFALHHHQRSCPENRKINHKHEWKISESKQKNKVKSDCKERFGRRKFSCRTESKASIFGSLNFFFFFFCLSKFIEAVVPERDLAGGRGSAEFQFTENIRKDRREIPKMPLIFEKFCAPPWFLVAARQSIYLHNLLKYPPLPLNKN